MYSYGDSTTFPLEENFLETLMATVQASAALFAYEVQLSESSSRSREARKAADLELAKLIGFKAALAATLNSAEGPASTQAAKSMRQAASKILAQAQNQVTAQCEQIVASSKVKDVGAQVHKILSRFWLAHQLPHTRWSFYWSLDEGGRTSARLRATSKLVSADFRCAIPQSDIWGAAISIAALLPERQINVPQWTRKSKGAVTAAESLDGYEVVEVDATASRRRLVLRKIVKAKHSVMITLEHSGQSAPTIVLLDDEGDTLGDTHVLTSSETADIHKLWKLLMREQHSLLESRSTLGEVSFGNRNINTIAHPSEIAEAMLMMVAPLAREIRLRSRVPGELILKRNIGKGRREEIFMSRDSLQEHYARLPDRFRRVYDSMGLGNESTCDFVTMIGDQLKSPPRERSRRQRVQKRPRADSLDVELNSVLLDIEAA